MTRTRAMSRGHNNTTAERARRQAVATRMPFSARIHCTAMRTVSCSAAVVSSSSAKCGASGQWCHRRRRDTGVDTETDDAARLGQRRRCSCLRQPHLDNDEDRSGFLSFAKCFPN